MAETGNASPSSQTVADPIEQTVSQIASLHAEHHEQTTPAQRIIDRVTAFCGKPAFVGWLIVSLFGWIAVNLMLPLSGYRPIDEAPFSWLQTLAGIAALCLAALILATQRRENELADHRQQLTLELTVLSDRKLAKIIELLEELRRDSPQIFNRVDDLAEMLSRPVDTKAVSHSIKQVQAELIGTPPPNAAEQQNVKASLGTASHEKPEQ